MRSAIPNMKIVCILFFLVLTCNARLKAQGKGLLVQDTSVSISDSLILRTITLEEAYDLHQSQTGIFVDSRSHFFYKRAHIRGSVSICYRCTDTSRVMKELPRDQLLIVYCSGPRCEQAQMLITKLLQNNFLRIYLFSGGMDAWRAAGYPIDEIDITKKTKESER